MEDRLVLSLNEVETLAAKAARGAGLGWGQAEDIGRAARWLAAREIAWAESLPALLADEPGRQALARTLDLADRIGGAKAGERWTASACPWLWTLPAVSAALYDRRIAVTLRVGERSFQVGREGVVTASLRNLDDLAPGLIAIEIRPGDAAEPSGHVVAARTRRSVLPLALYGRLDAWAVRTTVPASAASRQRGAGGRLDDE